MGTIRFDCWKVEILLSENDDRQIIYFANEGLARLAIEWAYAVHLDELHARSDVSHEDTHEFPALDDGSWKRREVPGKKVVWWKRSSAGYAAMKDYFTYDYEVFERTILDAA